MMVCFQSTFFYHRAIAGALVTITQVDAKAPFVSFLIYVQRVDKFKDQGCVWPGSGKPWTAFLSPL